MKKLTYTLFAVITAIIMFSSCEKGSVKVDVPYTQPTISFQLDSAALQGAKGEKLLYSNVVKLNIDSILKANKAGNIDGMTLHGAVIELTPGSPFNLNWISGAKITIQPVGGSEYRIANINSIGIGLVLIRLNTDAIELKDHFNNKEVTIRVYGVISGPLPVSYIPMLLKLDYILNAVLI